MADKLVQVGNEVVAFPDTMSEQEIAAVLSGEGGQQPQQRTMGQELGRQVGLTGREIGRAHV